MTANIIPFGGSTASVERSGKGKSTHILVHRFIDVILEEDLDINFYCPQTGDHFPALVHDIFHTTMWIKLERTSRLIELKEGQHVWPTESMIGLRHGDESGFVVRSADVVYKKADRSYRLLDVGGGNAVAYTVPRLEQDIATLHFYFDHRPDDPTALDGVCHFRQTITFDRNLKRFLCPLCGDPAAELFASTNLSQGYFGCVPCTATLDPEERARYRAALDRR